MPTIRRGNADDVDVGLLEKFAVVLEDLRRPPGGLFDPLGSPLPMQTIHIADSRRFHVRLLQLPSQHNPTVGAESSARADEADSQAVRSEARPG